MSQELESELAVSWKPSLCRLGGVMKVSDIEASGSGGSKQKTWRLR